MVFLAGQRKNPDKNRELTPGFSLKFQTHSPSRFPGFGRLKIDEKSLDF